jgi:flagellar secretion chaperone FliS
MQRSTPYQSYREVAARTATPGQLVLMLYEGVIRFLERALDGFALEDPAEYHETISNNVIRAQAILDELNQNLDMAAGGELSTRLRQLYDYLNDRLMESNLRKQKSGIEETIQRITVLRDAWKEMLQQDGVAASPRMNSLREGALA